MNMLVIVGAILALLGIAGLVTPVFTTQQTTDLAKVGDLKIQTQEDTTHVVPPLVSGSAVVLGIILVGGGLFRSRQS
jgi:hypothetical protein